MRDLVDVAEFDKSVRQKTQRPAAPTRRGASTRQGDQVGLLLAIEHSRTTRCGTTDEGTIKAALDKCYDAVAKDDSYQPRTFVAALQDLNAAIPKF